VVQTTPLLVPNQGCGTAFPLPHLIFSPPLLRGEVSRPCLLPPRVELYKLGVQNVSGLVMSFVLLSVPFSALLQNSKEIVRFAILVFVNPFPEPSP